MYLSENILAEKSRKEMDEPSRCWGGKRDTVLVKGQIARMGERSSLPCRARISQPQTPLAWIEYS